MLTTVNTFSGCAGFIKIILKFTEEPYLIHWYGEHRWDLMTHMYNIISGILLIIIIRL